MDEQNDESKAYASHVIGEQTITETPSGTHAWVANLQIKPITAPPFGKNEGKKLVGHRLRLQFDEDDVWYGATAGPDVSEYDIKFRAQEPIDPEAKFKFHQLFFRKDGKSFGMTWEKVYE